MAQIDLFIDTGASNAAAALVASMTDNTPATVPQLVQGDTPTLRIWLLVRTATYPSVAPLFTLVPTSGLSLEVAIGDKKGNTTKYYTQQFTWTANPSSDPALQYWTATLPLNTADITTLIGANSSAISTLEVKYLASALPTTVLSAPVTIQAAVIKAGALTVPAGQTAISAEEVNASFLKRTIQGAITLVSEDGTKSGVIYWDNDGTFHADPSS